MTDDLKPSHAAAASVFVCVQRDFVLFARSRIFDDTSVLISPAFLERDVFRSFHVLEVSEATCENFSFAAPLTPSHAPESVVEMPLHAVEAPPLIADHASAKEV